MTGIKLDKPKGEIDPRLLEEKINIYEKILKSKLKNINLSDNLKDLRSDIDSLIMERAVKKPEPILEYTSDKQIEKIKRDMMEKEYRELFNEVKMLKEESTSLKEALNTLEKEDIEKAKVLSSLKTYLGNNMKIEDLRFTPEESLKSGKIDGLEGTATAMAFYDYYKNLSDN